MSKSEIEQAAFTKYPHHGAKYAAFKEGAEWYAKISRECVGDPVRNEAIEYANKIVDCSLPLSHNIIHWTNVKKAFVDGAEFKQSLPVQSSQSSPDAVEFGNFIANGYWAYDYVDKKWYCRDDNNNETFTTEQLYKTFISQP